MQSKKDDLATNKIKNISEQCVKCGLCLPHCPTYKLRNSEGQSPRGRIALWQNLANSNLQLTQKTVDYLEACLSCGACVNNCPAGVKFLDLQDIGKNYLRTKKYLDKSNKIRLPTNWLNNLIIKLIANKHTNLFLAHFLYLYQKLKMHYLIRIILSPAPKLKNKINQLHNLLPPADNQNLSHKYHKYIKNLNNHKTVILFSGCINKLISNQVIDAAILLLNKLNITVKISDEMHCCGALYTHNGEFDKATTNIKQNINSISNIIKNNNQVEFLLTIDSGCHHEIAQQLLKHNINLKIINIEQFIYNIISNNSELRKLAVTQIYNTKSIYIYSPCSQREQLKLPNITKDLLQLVLPNANIKLIPKGFGCCGAAGRYMLDHPTTAEKLAKEIIDEFIEHCPEIKTEKISICTSNIGCALHLRNIIYNKYKLNCIIKHPIEVIADALIIHQD